MFTTEQLRVIVVDAEIDEPFPKAHIAAYFFECAISQSSTRLMLVWFLHEILYTATSSHGKSCTHGRSMFTTSRTLGPPAPCKSTEAHTI